MSWLDDIPGVKDVIDGTGISPITLPRRHKIKVMGSVVAVDNPATKTTELTFGAADLVPLVSAEVNGIVPATGANEGYVLTQDENGDAYWAEGTLYEVVDATQNGLAPNTAGVPDGYVLTVDGAGDVDWEEPPQLVSTSRNGLAPDTNGVPEGYVLTVDGDGDAYWGEGGTQANSEGGGTVPATTEGGGNRTLTHNNTGTLQWVTATSAHGSLSSGTLHDVASAAGAGFAPSTSTATDNQVLTVDGSGDIEWESLTSDNVANDSLVDAGAGTLSAALNSIKTALGLCLDNVAIQVFTADGTYTPAAGMKKCLVILTGSGAGGGGADTTNVDGQVAVGNGGAAGGTCIKLFDAATIGASQAVVIGAAGTGGSTSGGDGTAGGNATFGALLTANGGALGTGSGANTTVAAMSGAISVGGSATGGDVNLDGGDGGYGWAASSATCLFGASGAGGASFWGVGGSARAIAQASLSAGNNFTGRNAGRYGCGGSGGIVFSADTGNAGGNGSKGICVVLEFTESTF